MCVCGLCTNQFSTSCPGSQSLLHAHVSARDVGILLKFYYIPSTTARKQCFRREFPRPTAIVPRPTAVVLRPSVPAPLGWVRRRKCSTPTLQTHAPTSSPIGSCAGRGGGQCAQDVKVLEISKYVKVLETSKYVKVLETFQVPRLDLCRHNVSRSPTHSRYRSMRIVAKARFRDLSPVLSLWPCDGAQLLSLHGRVPAAERRHSSAHCLPTHPEPM